MDLKEIKRQIIHSFFVIFSGSVLSMYVYTLLFGDGILEVHYITALLVMTVLADLTCFIFYSKKELTRKQLLIRFAIHLPIIMGIMLSAASYMEWILWSEPVEIIVFIALVVAVYIMVVAISEYRLKKLADKLTEKLKERYKG